MPKKERPELSKRNWVRYYAIALAISATLAITLMAIAIIKIGA